MGFSAPSDARAGRNCVALRRDARPRRCRRDRRVIRGELFKIAFRSWRPSRIVHHRVADPSDVFRSGSAWLNRSSGIARERIGVLRHDVEIPQQHASSALVAATQLARSLAKILVDQRIDSGFLMPTAFLDPGTSAACDPRIPLCSLPGDSDSPIGR